MQWVVPEKIHTPPPHGGNFRCPKGEGGKIWSLKKSNRPYKIKWTILKHSSAYRSGRNQCNLCSDEKLFIMKFKKNSLLNKRSEIFSNCVHKKTISGGKIHSRAIEQRAPSYTTEERASMHAKANKTKRSNLVNRTLVVRRLSVNSGMKL